MKYVKTLALVFLSFCVAVSVLALYALQRRQIPSDYARQATAEIVAIRPGSQAANDIDGRNVTVRYQANEKPYEARLSLTLSRLAVGGKLDILYDVRDPSRITIRATRSFVVMSETLLGVIVLVALGMLLAIGRASKGLRKRITT